MEEVKRYDILCERFYSLAVIGETKAARSKVLMEVLDQVEEELQLEIEVCDDQDKVSNLSSAVKSPFKVNAKERPSINRLKSKDEQIMEISKIKVSTVDELVKIPKKKIC